MKTRTLAIIAPVAVAALLAGCASVPRDAGFADVRRTVEQRTGHRVQWNRGSAPDAAVESQLRTLLADGLSADEAVQAALLNNRNLQATYELLAVAQADLVAAGLLNNPVFDAEVRFAEAGGGTGLELAVVQDFIDLFYIPLRKRIAGAAFEAAKLRVAGEAIELAGDVRSAYFNAVAARQSVELRRQALLAAEAARELVERLRKAGNVTELEAATQRATYEQAKLDLAAAEAQLVQDRERLTVLMGIPSGDLAWEPADRLPDPPADETAAEGLERLAVERSLDLAAARHDARRAGQALGLARPLGFLGEVEAGVSAEREPEGEWLAGPAVSLPIPLFNQGQPQVARAAAELRRLRERYAATEVALRSRVRSAHAAVLAARRRAEDYHKLVLPLRQRVLDETQLQYNAMQVGAFQLLAARQQQIEAGESYVLALRDYWIARTQLDQLLQGKLTTEAPVAAPEAGIARSGAAGGAEGSH